MSINNNNYEPTSSVNYEQTTPNPYLNGSYLPPPPPDHYTKQRTGKLWKIAIPVFLVLIGSIVGILFYPVLTSVLYPSHVSTEKPTPYVPFGIVSTPTFPIATPTKAPQTLPSEAHVYDAANVLNVSLVQRDAASLSDPIDIYTTNTFHGSASAFDQRAAGHLTSSRLIVIAIDTLHKHLAIVGGSSVPLSTSQYSSARDAFVNSFRSNQDYTAATIAAIDSLRSSFTTDGY